MDFLNFWCDLHLSPPDGESRPGVHSSDSSKDKTGVLQMPFPHLVSISQVCFVNWSAMSCQGQKPRLSRSPWRRSPRAGLFKLRIESSQKSMDKNVSMLAWGGILGSLKNISQNWIWNSGCSSQHKVMLHLIRVERFGSAVLDTGSPSRNLFYAAASTDKRLIFSLKHNALPLIGTIDSKCSC